MLPSIGPLWLLTDLPVFGDGKIFCLFLKYKVHEWNYKYNFIYSASGMYMLPSCQRLSCDKPHKRKLHRVWIFHFTVCLGNEVEWQIRNDGVIVIWTKSGMQSSAKIRLNVQRILVKVRWILVKAPPIIRLKRWCCPYRQEWVVNVGSSKHWNSTEHLT
jgi:hypothetical protein